MTCTQKQVADPAARELAYSYYVLAPDVRERIAKEMGLLAEEEFALSQYAWGMIFFKRVAAAFNARAGAWCPRPWCGSGRRLAAKSTHFRHLPAHRVVAGSCVDHGGFQVAVAQGSLHGQDVPLD